MHINKINRFLMVVGLFAMVATLPNCGKSPQSSAPPPGQGLEVGVVTLRQQPVAVTTELPARISAHLGAEVRRQVSGIIQSRRLVECAKVKAGDVLYQIDPAPYQASYDNARAAMARSEANLPSIRSRVERYKELVEIKAVSRQDYDDASAALKQAQAEVEIAKAAVETARINLAYTRITAPISGRIGKSTVTVGALATAHQAIPFTTIQQLDPIFVDATQSSANLLQLKRNMASGTITGDSGQAPVKLLLEDGTPYPLTGSLKFSDITVEPSTGSFILRMVFPNPKHTLLPGMYVRTVIQEGVMDKAILAPQQGVSRDPKGNPTVLLVDKQGKVEQRIITVDRAIGDKWLVSSGLAAGDRLIVEGMQKVRPGSPVKAVPADDIPAGSPNPAANKTATPAKAK